jgi:hypothetical protein
VYLPAVAGLDGVRPPQFGHRGEHHGLEAAGRAAQVRGAGRITGEGHPDDTRASVLLVQLWTIERFRCKFMRASLFISILFY